MPNKAQPVQTTPPTERRQFLAGLDAVTLAEALDHHTNITDDVYARTKQVLLETFPVGAVEFAALLDHVDQFGPVEEAIRRAGFVLGFNTCRQLLLGELDLEALKGGEE